MEKELSASKPVVYKREFSVGESVCQSATRSRKCTGIEYNADYAIQGGVALVGQGMTMV